MNQTKMDYGEWMRHEERVAKLPDGYFSIGVGPDLVRQLGVTFEVAVKMFGHIREQLADGGANIGYANGIVFYARRRGKMIDVGSRKDYKELGWAKICDLLDSLPKPEGMK